MISSAARCQTKGLGVVVPVLGPVIDRGDELVNGAEAAPANPLVGDLLEPSLDEIQPQRRFLMNGRGLASRAPPPIKGLEPVDAAPTV